MWCHCHNLLVDPIPSYHWCHTSCCLSSTWSCALDDAVSVNPSSLVLMFCCCIFRVLPLQMDSLMLSPACYLVLLLVDIFTSFPYTVCIVSAIYVPLITPGILLALYHKTRWYGRVSLVWWLYSWTLDQRLYQLRVYCSVFVLYAEVMFMQKYSES